VGYLVNISNPIAVVFWLGIFGSLISASGEAAAETTALQQGLAILAGILTWHTSMSMLTHWGKRFVNERSARIISIVAGLALIGFGLRFAYNAIITIIS
jgi:threonine/homoserine/homoserine lactone efflux protein